MISKIAISMAACALITAPGLRAAACGETKPDAKDAVAVAGDTHKVLLDNDTVRVLEVTLAPGTKGQEHSHVWPAVIIEDTPKSGEVPEVRSFTTRWEGPVKSDKDTNSGKSPRHYLRMELKKSDCKPVANPQLPPTDGVTVKDPGIKVALENEYVRVLEVTVPVADKEPPHTHTWPAIVYYYRLPPSQRTNVGSAPQPKGELKQISVAFDPNAQPLHVVENLGKYTYQAHRIELKPLTDQKR